MSLSGEGNVTEQLKLALNHERCSELEGHKGGHSYQERPGGLSFTLNLNTPFHGFHWLFLVDYLYITQS